MDIICLQEINLDCTKSWVCNKLLKILKEHFGLAKLVTASSCISSPSPWKPGGVLIAAVGKWAQYVRATTSDRLGRWASLTITGTDGVSLNIYSVYNVVHNNIANAGELTAFAQQFQILCCGGIQQPNPRKQFISDLKRSFESIPDDKEIIVCRDLNKQLGENSSLFSSITAQHDLCNAILNKHGESAEIPTYNCGTKRLNYILSSRPLVPFIRKAGYNLFNELTCSNHQTAFIDIQLSKFMGTDLPKMTTAEFCFVQSRGPNVAKFINAAYSHLSENNAFKKYEEYNSTLSTNNEPWHKANQIDDIVTQALLHREKTCSFTPSPPWSPAVNLASKKVRFWRTALSQRCTNTNQTVILKQLQDEIWPDNPPKIPTNLQALKSVGQAAFKALRRIRRNARIERKKFLAERLEVWALRISPKDTKPEVAIKNIKRQLNDNATYSRIRQSVNPKVNEPLTKVHVTSKNEYLHPRTGERHTIESSQTVHLRDKLETEILSRNKAHFAQSLGTPFTVPPLSDIQSSNDFNLYQDANGDPIHAPQNAFLETTTVLEVLRKTQEEFKGRWDAKLSFDDFITSLLHWKERTTTSLSGRHLGLYQSLATAHCNSSGEFTDNDEKDPKSISTQDKATAILQLIHGLASDALQRGFYLKRWTYVLNIMIYKKPGVLDLDQLRVIHLFEADLNLLIGSLFERRAMHFQVDHSLMAESQFGRPGGECQDAALSKVLHNLISYIAQTPMGQFKSDARACFDRIVMAFALLCFMVHAPPPRSPDDVGTDS